MSSSTSKIQSEIKPVLEMLQHTNSLHNFFERENSTKFVDAVKKQKALMARDCNWQ